MKAATLLDAFEGDVRIISIHAAREGGDVIASSSGFKSASISIHAAREGGDYKRLRVQSLRQDFNPRRP